MEGYIPDPTWDNLSWPLLHTLELNDLFLSSNSFVGFITRHDKTLSSLALMRIGISGGTWEEPLQEVTKMKQLCHFHLIDLFQPAPSVEDPHSFELIELIDTKIGTEVVLGNKDDINLATEVFRHKFWTTELDSEYLVDLRLVRAVVEGEISYKNGRWEGECRRGGIVGVRPPA
ncbi:hypothetical protein K505DRAFT_368793 [Melanomma pulvis-pyrius CBS 109.77]|uniref:Uncharacterized protein n=1 Tax=Melanomma pulvis-pyrius CBS 109.77 TaxID=1314802 RepID=A0A6A6WPM6_9PLEO|nr:hypothetical protein K505DRAFT_368793 [Melanomma pulvis-pyrius CBS 109.77]